MIWCRLCIPACILPAPTGKLQLLLLSRAQLIARSSCLIVPKAISSINLPQQKASNTWSPPACPNRCILGYANAVWVHFIMTF